MPTFREVVENLRSNPGLLNNPCYMEVSLMGNCNFACIQCHQLHHIETDRTQFAGTGPKRLDPQRVSQLLDEAKELGVETIEFCGRGEPTLFPNLDALIRRTKELGFKGSLITNGSHLTEKLCNAIGESGFDEVSISLYGVTEQMFSEIARARGGILLERLVENILYLRKAAPRTKIVVIFLLQDKLLVGLEQMFELMRRLGADSYKFVVSLPYHDKIMEAGESETDSTERFARALRESYERVTADPQCSVPPEFASFVEQYLRAPEIDTIETTYSKVPCYAGQWAVFVCDDGTIRPCSNSNWVLGDLFQSSLREIWRGSAYEGFRKAAARHIIETKTPLYRSYCSHCGWARVQTMIHELITDPQRPFKELLSDPA